MPLDFPMKHESQLDFRINLGFEIQENLPIEERIKGEFEYSIKGNKDTNPPEIPRDKAETLFKSTNA